MSKKTAALEASDPKRLPLDERRAQLLALGRKLFSERSYDEVAIDDIAERAGISKGLLYHYFGSKRDFYVATIVDAADQLQRCTEPDLTLAPADRARAGIEAYLSFVIEHAGAYSALLRGGIGHDPQVAEIVDTTRAAIVSRMIANLGLTDARPIFRFVLRGWIGLVEAASLDWLERREVSREIVVRLMLESLYSSLVIATRLDPESGFVFDLGSMPPGGVLTPPPEARSGTRKPARR